MQCCGQVPAIAQVLSNPVTWLFILTAATGVISSVGSKKSKGDKK